jgi:2-dehydropantoate 2-reductase
VEGKMPKKIKNICVYGIGGVGGYFGGRIAHKISSDNLQDMEVYFIGRGEHLKTVQQQGLKLITDREELQCFPNIATDNVKNIPIPDLYLLCVKGYDLDNTIASISRKVSSGTVTVPLLNGVDIYERTRKNLKEAVICPAAVYVSSSIEKPGIIRQKGPEGHIVFGKDPKRLNHDYKPIVNFFKEMKISSDWYDNPYPAIWEKYIFIAAFSLMTAYTNKTIGGVLKDRKLRKMTEDIMNEVVSVGKANNVELRENIVEETIQKAQNFPGESKTSFQRDYEKGKEKTELDIFGGALIRLAKEHNIDIPVTTKVYSELI